MTRAPHSTFLRTASARRALMRRLVAIPLVLSLAGGAAWAYWSATSVAGGNGASSATSVNQGATPTASAVGASVTVSWAASTLASGGAVGGYIVKRYDVGMLAPQTILSACTGTVTATSCVESSVPDGQWVYSVTPVVGTNWQGAESVKSSTVSVKAQSPVAVADGYTVNEDATLTVAAAGILANDSDAQSDPLTSILVTGVANGTLTSFGSNGAFVYVPKPDFNGTDSFSYRANDGVRDSTVVAVTITVTAVNDPPVNVVPGPQQTPKSTNVVFSSASNNLLAIGDPDAAGSTVQVQLTGTNGTATLAALAGLVFSVGDGTSDATMTFTGTIANVNLALNGATFIPAGSFTGAATLQIVTSDRGNTGTGGTLTDTDSVTINVNSLGIFTANQDIGAPGLVGSSTYSAGTYTVQGGGADIWNAADQFQYLYRDLTGNGRLTARIVSELPAGTNYAAKTSVMLRESTATGSKHTTMDLMQTAGTEFLYRATTDGSTAATGASAAVVAPYWVRITRVGDVIAGEYSPDGVTWTTQGAAQTVAMNASIKVGLAVTAHDNTKLLTATYNNVGLTTPPTAVADTYATNEDTTLTVAAPGVLSNDTDPENNALTAVLVSGAPGLALNPNGSFAYVPPANFSGAASFSYKANNGVFDSNTVTVSLTVNPANETPSFTKGANQGVPQVAGTQTVAGWATAISQGAGESGQLVNFTTTNDNNALFSVQPSVSAAGTLSYVPNRATTGVATVSVSLRDNGGTANGGVDTSAIQTFTITTTLDNVGPAGGSVDASGLVGTGGRYASSTSLSLNLAKGTDPSGVAATGALLKRATATLTSTGVADGICGSFGTYSLIGGGTDPATPKADIVTDQACFSYQYVVSDTLGNPTTYTSPVIKVDLTVPGAAPALAHSAFTNTYWSGAGSTVYYRSAAATGSFTTTGTASDTASGIGSFSFPALGSNWTSTPGALGVNTYAWTGAPAVPGTKNVTATNNATGVSGGTSFTPTADDTAPSAGSVTPPNASQASTSVTIAFTTGTDGGSGVGTRLLQRQSAPLTATCGIYGGWTTVATNPASSPFSDTVTGGFCYKYQFLVSDNVGNTNAATSGNVVQVTAASSPVKAQYNNNEPAAPTDNSIQPHLQLVNTSAAGVDLSTMTVRYWFTKEAGASTFSTPCFYATAGCSNVTTSVIAVSPRAGADGYVLVGFLPSTLAAGASSEVQLGLNKTDWSVFNEVDDYSYGTGTSYTDSTKVTVYQGGTLIWGTEP